MGELAIWVVTVPAVAIYLWAIIGWKHVKVRIAATALFMAFWLGVPEFTTMGLVWRIAMPVVVLIAMASILMRSSRPRPAGPAQ